MSKTSRGGDRNRLLAAAFARATGTSLVGVLLGLHLAQLGFSPATIGLVAGAGLAGAVLGVAAVTRWGDRFGRRRSLVVASLVAAFGSALMIVASDAVAVALAAGLGMVNAMGRDRGAALVVEQAALPATVPDRARTRVFAWYGALQDAGHALGSLLAAVPSVLTSASSLSERTANRFGLALLPLVLLVSAGVYRGLSPGIEARRKTPTDAPATVDPATREQIRRLATLFSLDGFGGGLLLTSLLSYFFFERFGASAVAVSVLFFCARVVNFLSNFLAAALAQRIGLVNTMVFTHIPSSLLLIGVALVPTFGAAATLFLLREVVAQMDVPTRQSYVMAVVEPEARVLASGVTNITRLAGWASGPLVAGVLMQHVALVSPLFAGAGCKIVYDLLLFRAFRHLPPPEERQRAARS